MLLELLEQRDCPTAAVPFSPGDVLVVSGNNLYEYTAGGGLVQSFTVANPPDRPIAEEARGVAVGPGGLAYLFNGTANPYLSALDPASQTWSHETTAGWSLTDVAGYGEIGVSQQYAFAPDMDGSGAGILRFDLAAGTSSSFATATAYDNVSVGLDGKLYALQSSAPVLDVFDPATMSLIGSVNLLGASGDPTDPRGVAVDAAGNIFTADASGFVIAWDSAGNILGSANAGVPLTSIAVSSGGQLVVGTINGDVAVTTTGLSGTTTFTPNAGAEAFVAIVPQAWSPVITSASSATFTAGGASTFTVSSLALPTASLSETGALPTGVSFTDNGNGTASLSGTPDAGTGGTYSFTITAHNSAGVDSTQSFTLTVDEAPTLATDVTVWFNQGEENSTIVDVGHEFPVATLTLDGTLPDGVTFADNGDGTGTLQGTPADGTIGSYALTVTAHNGVGSDVVQNLTLKVGLKTVTTLVVTPANPVFGRPVTLVATAVPGVGTVLLKGTVTFYDGDTQVGNPVNLVGRKATLVTSALSAGSHSFTAVYNGGGNYAASESDAVDKTIAAAATRVYLTPSSLAPVYGQPLTFTAKVRPSVPGLPMPTGTVAFMDGETQLGTATLTNGTATLSGQVLTVGTHPVTAVFTSDNPNEGNATSLVLNEKIGLAHAKITLTATPKPAVVGQTVTLTATVTALAPSTYVPSGSITFKDGLNVLGTAEVIDGVATFTTDSLFAGTHTFMTTFGGDGNTAGTLNFARLLVNRATTSVDVSDSPTTGLAGDHFTLTARVNVADPAVVDPSGQVAFYRGAALLGNGIVTDGVATFTTPVFKAGTYNITAVYRGDLKCLSSSASWTLTVSTVGQGTASVAFTSPAAVSPAGTPVSFTATLTGVDPAGTPTGTVTFFDGTTQLGSASLVDGSASSPAVKLSSGTHSITAQYSGDVAYGPATSAVWTQTIRVGTTTNLTVSTLAPVFGQPVTLTARVDPSSFSATLPTGTVTFLDGTTELGTGTLTNGVATLSGQALAVGAHELTAVYTSDSELYATSTSPVVTENVGQARTTVAFSASPSPAVYGETVVLTATVNVTAPGSATPSGQVTFKDGVTVLGTVDVVDGVATFSTNSLFAGSHTFTVSYSGDTNTAASSNTGKLTVNQASTSVDLSDSPSSGLGNQTMTLTARVSVVAPGVADPTGTVAFFRGSTLLGTGTVTGGVATFTTQKLAAGSYDFVAVYRGDSHCKTSTSTTWTVTVVNAPVVSSVTLASANTGDAAGTVSIAGGNIVTATVTATDPQGLALSYTYVWKVDGVVVWTDSADAASTKAFDLATVAGGVSAGQQVTVEVTANDGFADSVAVASTTLDVTL